MMVRIVGSSGRGHGRVIHGNMVVERKMAMSVAGGQSCRNGG